MDLMHLLSRLFLFAGLIVTAASAQGPENWQVATDIPNVDLSGLGAIHTPSHGWPGPGYWHPMDMCFVRMRTSRGEVLGLLSVDSDIDRPIPDVGSFELLRLFAMVGANAVENVLLVREIAGLEEEREKQLLRRELEEEVALRHSLLEIGGRLGAG